MNVPLVITMILLVAAVTVIGLVLGPAYAVAGFMGGCIGVACAVWNVRTLGLRRGRRL